MLSSKVKGVGIRVAVRTLKISKCNIMLVKCQTIVRKEVRSSFSLAQDIDLAELDTIARLGASSVIGKVDKSRVNTELSSQADEDNKSDVEKTSLLLWVSASSSVTVFSLPVLMCFFSFIVMSNTKQAIVHVSECNVINVVAGGLGG